MLRIQDTNDGSYLDQVNYKAFCIVDNKADPKGNHWMSYPFNLQKQSFESILGKKALTTIGPGQTEYLIPGALSSYSLMNADIRKQKNSIDYTVMGYGYELAYVEGNVKVSEPNSQPESSAVLGLKGLNSQGETVQTFLKFRIILEVHPDMTQSLNYYINICDSLTAIDADRYCIIQKKREKLYGDSWIDPALRDMFLSFILQKDIIGNFHLLPYVRIFKENGSLLNINSGVKELPDNINKYLNFSKLTGIYKVEGYNAYNEFNNFAFIEIDSNR